MYTNTHMLVNMISQPSFFLCNVKCSCHFDSITSSSHKFLIICMDNVLRSLFSLPCFNLREDETKTISYYHLSL